MAEIGHNPGYAPPLAAVPPDEASRLIVVAIDAMRAAPDDDVRLAAVRNCSRQLSPGEAIDRLSDVAIDIFDLPVDQVQAALAGGQELRRLNHIRGLIKGAQPFGPLPDELVSPGKQLSSATTRKAKPKAKSARKALSPAEESPVPQSAPNALSLVEAAAPPPAARPGDFDIGDMNREYAFVLLGRHAVIYRDLQGADDTHRFLSLDAFNAFFENRFTEVPAHDGRVRHITWAKAWRQHRDRRAYNGIEFWPSADNEPGQPGFLNFWTGFAVEPALLPDERRYSIFKDHLLTNVCNGDSSLFRYLWGWLANLVQTPRDRPGVALVFRGGRGVGKTIIGQIIGRLFPRAYKPVSDPRYVTGNFNSHLAHLLVLQADEALWAGNKEAEGKLKDLITSLDHMIEVKGIEPILMRNFIHLILTSNEAWTVPAGPDERRYAVFDVSPRCQGNHPYFAEMSEQLDNGGLSHLLANLLEFDLSTVNLRQIPKTTALLNQKIHTLESVNMWWLDRLKAGAPTSTMDDWPEAVLGSILFHDYIKVCEEIGIRRKRPETIFGQELRALMPESVDGPPGLRREKRQVVIDPVTGETKRSWHYVLPTLDEARQAFETFMEQPIDWSG